MEPPGRVILELSTSGQVLVKNIATARVMDAAFKPCANPVVSSCTLGKVING